MNLRECTEEEDRPGTIRHTSIHKAKGLDAKAIILIGLPPHRKISSDYDHYSWFMGASRARQVLAVVETPIPKSGACNRKRGTRATHRHPCGGSIVAERATRG